MIKNKIIITLGLAVFVLIAGLYIYLNKQQVDMVDTTIDPVLLPVKKALSELQQDKQFKKLSDDKKLEKTYEILEKLPPEYKQLKHQYQIAMSSLPSITFYGRVIDQNSQPVIGARINYTGTNAYLSEGGGRGRVITDDEGYFEIDTSGASLVIGGVSHNEIDKVLNSRKKDGTETSKTGVIRFLSHKDNQGNYPNWRNHTKKETAYIIHAWRLGKYEGAKKGNLAIDFTYLDGRQYTVDLTANKYNKQVKEGSHSGQFIVGCIRKTNMEKRIDYGDWTAFITPINGGIQVTNDLYMNEAPESGYKSSISINMKLGESGYTPQLYNQRYYFKANNESIYGSVIVNYMPHARFKENFCRIDIRNFKYNPTGLRNLELKRQPTSKVEPIESNRTTYAMR